MSTKYTLNRVNGEAANLSGCYMEGVDLHKPISRDGTPMDVISIILELHKLCALYEYELTRANKLAEGTGQ